MEPLYEKDKVWKISWFPNEDGSYSIKTEHGKVNGKMVEHIILVKEGKNKGKKNETTVEQQAISMAQSDWNKKIRQGYHEADSDQERRVLKPMLALEYKGNVAYPVWVQPKLDGVRCLLYAKEGRVVFQSRQNTVYPPFEHLVNEVQGWLERMPPNTVLDGELYTHGMGFEEIVSMVRRSKKRTVDIHYTVYDFFIPGEATLPYEERLGVLTKARGPENHVHLIETQKVACEAELSAWLPHYLERGYEGIMVRRNGVYKEGRSKDLLKYKLFKDEEYEVVGHHMSKVGDPVPIFDCRTSDGKLFGVMMKENHEEKIKRMENIEGWYGKKLTVKYQELTKEGIPRFPVGIGFRDYE
jgi:DNA ligase-1